jgi:hypothetical protein
MITLPAAAADAMPHTAKSWKRVIERGIEDLYDDGWRLVDVRLPERARTLWAEAEHPVALLSPDGTPISIGPRVHDQDLDLLCALAVRPGSRRRALRWTQLFPLGLGDEAEVLFQRLRTQSKSRRPSTGMCVRLAEELLARSSSPAYAVELFVDLAPRLGRDRALNAAVRLVG